MQAKARGHSLLTTQCLWFNVGMNLPNIGQNQNNYNYQIPNDPGVKKKLILFGGGVVILIIALIMVFTSGGGSPGMEPMRAALQSTNEALGIMDEYEAQIQSTDTKNEVALMQILVRGNFQKLNGLYQETYKPKSGFSSAPTIDAESKEALDRSARNNTLDSDILTALKPKVAEAQKQLSLTLPSFTTPSSVEMIETSIKDLASVEEILNSAR